MEYIIISVLLVEIFLQNSLISLLSNPSWYYLGNSMVLVAIIDLVFFSGNKPLMIS